MAPNVIIITPINENKIIQNSKVLSFTYPDCKIDLEAHVFKAETNDIIGQYIIFCHVLDEQIKDKGRTREAAEEAIRICQNRGVLADYLKGREVVSSEL